MSYEKDGEKYYIVDAHCHFWDASRENWKPGREEYAKGWIDCFYGYHQLAPPETHWDYEKYLKVTPEDFEQDMFVEGYVDKVVFQSTYLYDWYTEGFNTADRNGGIKDLLPKYADRFIVNGRFDPREGEAGLKQLEEDAKKWNLKGVKVYTAEWYNDSRGWRLDSPEAYRFLEKCQELGIKNIHAHKGPTIWPLDKDAFSPVDIDAAATDHQDLNFIVEHAAIPRIEDFCFMAVQEPNVYAGLSVVLGGLMHARPKFFAKVMGELLFWVGEDKLTFGSDYNIWTPKWQIEGFVDWQMPDDEAFTDFGKLTTATKKKILGLNAAKLYDIEVPAEFAVDTTADETGAPGSRARRRHRRGGCPGVTDLRDAVWRALDTVIDPELDEPITGLEFVESYTVSEEGVATVRLRLPTFFCAPNFSFLMVADAYDAVSAVPGVTRADVTLADHHASAEINGGVAAQAGFVRTFAGSDQGEAVAELDELRLEFFRKAALAGQDRVARPLVDAGAGPDELAAMNLGEVPPSGDLSRMRQRREALGLPHGDDAPLLIDADGNRIPSAQVPLHLRRARLQRVGIEANGEYCKGLLAARYPAAAH